MFRISSCVLLAALMLAAGGCRRDPKVVSGRYVESGNKYFERQKYKEASLMYRQAIAKDRMNGQAYYHLALTEMKLGQLPGAWRSLLRAVELLPETDPAKLDARVKLADLCLLGYMGDPRRRPKHLLEEARKQADEILKADPKAFPGLRIKGYLALIDNQRDEALKFFEQAQAAKPFQRDVVLTLVQVLASQGRFADAERLAKETIEKDKSYGQMYDVLYIEYVRRKQPAEAEAILKAKVENNPKDVRPRLQLADHYARAQREADMEGVLKQILDRPQDFPMASREVGDFYIRRNRPNEALRYYNEGAQKDAARKTEYQKRIVGVLVQQGKRAEAAQLVDSILAANPKDSEATAMRASLVLDSGRRELVDKAIADLQSVLTTSQGNPVVRYDLGRAYLAKGDLEQARIQFQDAIKQRADFVPARLALARLLLLKGDFTGALNMANETLKFAPANIGARLMRTSALAALGDSAQTRKELAEINRIHPNSREAQFQLGVLNLQEKKYAEAEAIFLKLRESNPEDIRPSLALVDTYRGQGRSQQAMSVLQSEIAKHPERREFRLSLAALAAQSGDHATAMRELSALIQQNPKEAGLHIRLGETQRLAGDYRSALESFRKARELAPKDPGANLYYALMLEATGQSALSKPVYEEVLKLQPDNAVALNNLAYLLAESGQDLDHALTLAQRAKQRMPNDPNVSDTLGWIYIKKNLSEQAIQIYRDLVQKNPNHVTWRYHLAMALYQKGDKLAARRELETCLRNKPTRDEETKIRELMARLG